MADVTLILNAIKRGDDQANAQLLPMVYEELRRLAGRQMGQERRDHTLQATALVHEAYLRLVGGEALCWESRGRFFAAASEAMRRILIEHARRKKALRYGGGQRHVDVADHEPPVLSTPGLGADELLDLDESLDRLAQEYPQKAELVKLTFFGGLSIEEAADVMGISRATAYRGWTFARAWLRDAVGQDQSRA